MKAELYTLSYCPFCVAALQLLDQRGIEYDNHVMDTATTPELDEVKQRYSHSTVPIILLDGEFIGGSDDLKRLDGEGKLG